MALLDLDIELARSSDVRPFSNGYEGQSWMLLWCLDCATDEDTCPLVAVALLGRTPAAWTEREPGGLNRYTCHEYEEIEQPPAAEETP